MPRVAAQAPGPASAPRPGRAGARPSGSRRSRVRADRVRRYPSRHHFLGCRSHPFPGCEDRTQAVGAADLWSQRRTGLRRGQPPGGLGGPGGIGGTSLAVGVRWFRNKDAGSVRSRRLGATEDAVFGANSAARQHRRGSAEPSLAAAHQAPDRGDEPPRCAPRGSSEPGPSTQWRVWSSSSPSATFSRAASIALIWVITSMQ